VSVAPHLHVVNAETGELVEDERDVLIEQLQADLQGKILAIGKLKRELRHLRAVEPESEVVREVLEYWRERCAPRATIAPGGKRWEKVRDRLKDQLDDRPSWTPNELRLAVDGALLDPWLSGSDRKSKGYLDAQTIFRDAEMVERLRDLALGFQAQAGTPLRDLIDVAAELRFVNWRHLLRVCECGHRRVEHARGDSDHGGRERCFFCGCEDFFEDPFERFNERR
jgi:hypothetical protein